MSFFIVSLLFVIVFIGANVKFMTFIRAWQPAEKPRNGQLEGEAGESDKSEGDFTKWIVRVLTVSVVIIGSLLGSLTVIGIVTLVLGFENPENVLMGFGLVVVTGMIFWKKLNALVRYTILISGLLLGAGAAMFAENVLVLFVFLALTIAAFIYIAGMVHRIFFFLAAILITGAILTNWMDSSVIIMSVIAGLLFAMFAGGQVIRNAAIRQPVLYSSYPSFLLTLFALTFMTESAWYYVTNALFCSCGACPGRQQTAAYSLGFQLVDGFLDSFPRVQILRFSLETAAQIGYVRYDRNLDPDLHRVV